MVKERKVTGPWEIGASADAVLCNGDSVVSKTQKVPVLMELTFWWRKTDKKQGNKQDNFR